MGSYNLLMGIHYWPAFLVFVVLGIAQTAVAVDSGYLAVLALPPDVSTKRKRRHQRFFGFLAIVLLGGTLLIGKLSDKSQWEADQKAKTAERKADDANSDLTKTRDGIGSVFQQIAVLKQSLLQPPEHTTARSEKLALQVSQIQHDLRDLVPKVDASSTLPVTPQAQQPPPNLMPQTQPSPVPDVVRARLANAELAHQATELAQKLYDEAGSADNELARFIHQIAHPGTDLNQDAIKTQYSLRAAEVRKQQAEAYKSGERKQVALLRSQLINRLQLSPEQSRLDEKKFTLSDDAASVNGDRRGIANYLLELSSSLPNH